MLSYYEDISCYDYPNLPLIKNMPPTNMQLLEKDGQIYSHIRKKWLVKTPEERVRQEYLLELVNSYGYRIEQMKEEEEITGRGSAGARADFVIWKDTEAKQQQKPPLIIVECKADNVKIDEKTYNQGDNYARLTGAPFFVTHNNNDTRYWRVKTDKMPKYIEEIEDIPKVDASERQIEELLARLKVFKENEFADLLHSCHNIIRNREKLDPAAAFDEIAKVLFMKVYAERNLKADMKGNIFTLDYINEAEKYNPDYLRDIFEKTKSEFGKDKLFAKDERIKLRVNTIKAIVEKLERYNLSATSTDVKGIAFERFLGKTFRGEIGQFFTPRSIVEFMVKMLDPQEGDVICDPAAGSGGFLIRFFEIMRELIHASVDAEYRKEKKTIEKSKASQAEKVKKINAAFERTQQDIDPEREGSRIWELANRCIYGTDANDRMARTSKMNMIMHGDGHGGIHHHDGFLNVNGIFEGRFDIVATNPPFGANVEKDDVVIASQVETDMETARHYRDTYGDAYEHARQKIEDALGEPITSLFTLPKSTAIKTEILFIERCLDLLKEGGRLGIVLPEGIFNNPNAQYVREFTEDRAFLRAVISLPQETFTSAGANVKASLLFLQKFNEHETAKWQGLLAKHRTALEHEQQKEQEKLTDVTSERKGNKEKKKEAKKKLKKMDTSLDAESRKRARADFDYPIFMCEAEHVGITSTGETGDNVPNELPDILDQYKTFLANPEAFASSHAT